MNHSEAKKLTIKGHELTRELSGYIFRTKAGRRLEQILFDINNVKENLFASGNIKLLNQVYRYGFSVLDPDGLKATAKLKPKLTKREATILFKEIAVHPAQIVKFLGDDKEFNRIVIESSLKTGTLHDIDHRDAKPWEDVALRLARLSDSDNWAYLLSEAVSDPWGYQLPPIIATLDEFENIGEEQKEVIVEQVNIYLDYCQKEKKYAFDAALTERAVNGLFKNAGQGLAKRALSMVRLNAVRNPNFLFDIYDSHCIVLDDTGLMRDLSPCLCSGGLAGSGYSLLWIVAKHRPHLIVEAVTSLTGSRSSYAHQLAAPLKQLNKPITVNGVNYEASDKLIKDLTSLLLESSQGDKLKDIIHFLEQTCGLKREQYIGLTAFAPFKRQMLSSDLEM